MRLNWSHQKALFNPLHAKPVTLIGAGSVGSNIALLLARQGIEDLLVLDADEVASHNVPMSAYRPCDVGRPKVEALHDLVREATALKIGAVGNWYTDQPLRGTVIASVDTMDARSAIWKTVRMNPAVDILIDTRLYERYGEVYFVRPCLPEDMLAYEARLYPQDTTVKRTCGNHGIAFMANLVASLAVAGLTDAWAGDKTGFAKRLFLGDPPRLETVNAT
ncbi:ThiF family adenylyltransferase [Candidatus Uhrbacteria bacterium]|nr:ThiF family adenylyltransferase [Candidatus Uhrbacteria bacterium]